MQVTMLALTFSCCTFVADPCDASKGLVPGVSASNPLDPFCRFDNVKCFLKPGQGQGKDDDNKCQKGGQQVQRGHADGTYGDGSSNVVMVIEGERPVPLRFSIGSQLKCLVGIDPTGGVVPTVQPVDCTRGTMLPSSSGSAATNVDKVTDNKKFDDDDDDDDCKKADAGSPLKCQNGIYTYTLRSSAVSKKVCYRVTLNLVEGTACTGVFQVNKD